MVFAVKVFFLEFPRRENTPRFFIIINATGMYRIYVALELAVESLEEMMSSTISYMLTLIERLPQSSPNASE